MQKNQPEDVFAAAVLYKLRKEHNTSRGVLAEALGVSQAQIQKYENGTNRLTPAKIQKACIFFECSPLVFFDMGEFIGSLQNSRAVDTILKIKELVK